MTRAMKWTAAVLFAALVAATLLGRFAGADSLSGTNWRLTRWTVQSIDPATVTITASFKDGQIDGRSGVNSYGGPYTLGANRSIAIGQLSSTLMAGPDPAMRAESAYDTLLTQAASFKIAGNTLTLFDKNGNESLRFTQQR